MLLNLNRYTPVIIIELKYTKCLICMGNRILSVLKVLYGLGVKTKAMNISKLAKSKIWNY